MRNNRKIMIAYNESPIHNGTNDVFLERIPRKITDRNRIEYNTLDVFKISFDFDDVNLR